MNTYRLCVLLIGAILLAAPAWSQGIGGFAGPSVLSRGAGTIGQRSGRGAKIRFFANVTGTWDDGIVPVSVDSNGKIPTIGGTYGEEVMVGAYGVKEWRRSQLGLDYTGSYRHYNAQPYLDGSEQTLQLGFTTQPTKRIQLNLREVAGTTSRGLGAYSGIAVADVSALGGTTALLFDNRANFIQSSADMVYQRTNRLSFVAGGDGYTVRRQSKALVGVNGYSLRGGVQYQLSKATSVVTHYTFTHYDFPRAFGESDIHAVQIGLVRRLNRRWALNAEVGGFHALAQGLQRVGLDPAIAALLGTGTVIQAFYRETTLPSFSGSLMGNYRLYTINFLASRSVNPGNGVYLTSSSENYSGQFSYTGIRRASIGASFGYSRLASIGQSLGKLGQYNGGASFGYQLFNSVSFTGRYDYRQSAIDLVGYKRTGNRISIGFAFSPGEVPFSWF